MAESPHINLVTLRRRAKWKYPVSGNVLTGRSGEAVAVACDDCIESNRNISAAIELRGDEIFYHPVTELDELSEVSR